MGFINRNGKKLSAKDIEVFRRVLKESLEGYLGEITLSDASLDDEYNNPALIRLRELSINLLAKFDEASEGEADISLENFYDNGMLNLYNEFMNWPQTEQDENNPYYTGFIENFQEHFVSRYNGKDLKNKALGLEKTMNKFKLKDTSFPGIETIPEVDLSKPYEDPYVSARQANSNTFASYMISNNVEAMKKVNDDFKKVTDFSHEVASQLYNKETVGFGDLYEFFSKVNKMLDPNEPRCGKVRVKEIGAGKISGIDSVAVPPGLFTTLDKIADYINEIKKVKDPAVRKSQAVQLAAFAYQMTLSEHIFGNGNGRSCRLFADTILQTFGLPPQIPTQTLIAEVATIGKDINFDKGAECFCRGLALTAELIRVKESSTISTTSLQGVMQIKNEYENAKLIGAPTISVEETLHNIEANQMRRAKLFLDSEHIDHSILKVTSPGNAINLAVQSAEDRFGLASHLQEFISADHFWTWNSGQYKRLIETTKKALKVINEEPVYSQKSLKAMSELEQKFTEYEEHCKRHPKNNDTRRKRLEAVTNMKVAVASIQNLSTVISKLGATALKNDMAKINGKIVANFTDEMLTKACSLNEPRDPKAKENRELIAQYVIRKAITKYVDKRNGNFDYEKAMRFSEDASHIKEITTGSKLFRALTEAKKNPSFAEKTMEEKLDMLSDAFIASKKKEARLENAPEKVTEETKKETIMELI